LERYFNMLPEIKKIVLAIVVTGFVGALFGGIMGGLAADFLSLEYFLWVGISTVVGAGLGVALAYGLLPES
jgi:cation transporter-like permease